MEKTYKIVFLGDMAVGKTTLISQYLYSKVHAPTPTIGIDFLCTSYNIDGKTVKVELWDTAGQERFHSIIGNYTRNTFLAIIVFAIDNPESVKRMTTWIEDFVFLHNLKEDVRLMVVANKIDLNEESNEEMKLALATGRSIADIFGASFVVSTALKHDGIEAMVSGINEFIRDDLQRNPAPEPQKTNKVTLKPRKIRRCC